MLNKHDYEMITDLMNAIKIAECESWVKNLMKKTDLCFRHIQM